MSLWYQMNPKLFLYNAAFSVKICFKAGLSLEITVSKRMLRELNITLKGYLNSANNKTELKIIKLLKLLLIDLASL